MKKAVCALLKRAKAAERVHLTVQVSQQAIAQAKLMQRDCSMTTITNSMHTQTSNAAKQDEPKIWNSNVYAKRSRATSSSQENRPAPLPTAALAGLVLFLPIIPGLVMGARGQLLGLLGLLACCCALLRGDVINKYMKYNPKASESTIEEYEFDWIAYLDMNPDVVGPKMDQDFAWQHYYEFGKKEGRHYPRRFPEDRSLANAEKKMIAFVGSLDRRRVSVSERTLLLYYLPTVPDATSHDALMNTFKIFLQAVDKDTLSSNFYWFNVLQGDESPFSRYIPRNRTNVVQLHWEGAIEQNLLQLRTLDLLHGSGMHTAFGSVYFGDVYTRGPLALEANGQWIAAYRSLLNKHNTGLVGASFSCELVPHVQNHSWAIHQNTVPLMLNAFTLSNGYRKWKGIVRYNLQYLSVLVMKKHNISSLLYQNALKEEYFSGRCLTPQGVEASKNPIYWSNLPLSQLVFVPWDYHTYIHQSASMKSAMIAYLYEFHSRSPSAQLFIPETVYGGYMHDLTLQYNYEMYMEAIAAKFAHNHPKNIDADGTGRLGQQVCLLVRSSYIHSKDRNISLLDEDFFSGFDNLAKCKPPCPCCHLYGALSQANFTDGRYISFHTLRTHAPHPQLTPSCAALLRQTDGNWIAYYFITDHFPFSTKLKKILAEFGDSRLQFLHIPRQFRQQVSPALSPCKPPHLMTVRSTQQRMLDTPPRISRSERF